MSILQVLLLRSYFMVTYLFIRYVFITLEFTAHYFKHISNQLYQQEPTIFHLYRLKFPLQHKSFPLDYYYPSPSKTNILNHHLELDPSIQIVCIYIRFMVYLMYGQLRQAHILVQYSCLIHYVGLRKSCHFIKRKMLAVYS